MVVVVSQGLQTKRKTLWGELRGILEEVSVEHVSEPASSLGALPHQMPRVTHLHHPRSHDANCGEREGRARRGKEEIGARARRGGGSVGGIRGKCVGG